MSSDMFEKQQGTKNVANIKSLQKLFMVVGVFSIAIILFGSTWGFKSVFTDSIVKMAEADAVSFCELLLDFAKDDIMKGDASKYVVVTPDDIVRLDHGVSPFVDHLNVIKIKIFDRNSRVVYSTDKSIIGKLDKENPRLLRALNGSVDTKMKEKKTPDLREEKIIIQKIVETYVPIKNDLGLVVGSFEIYLLVDRYDQANRRGLVLITLIMATVLLGTFAVSYGVIGQSVRQVQDAHGLLQQVAITDALTGVANRRHLFIRGKEELDRVRRSCGKTGGRGLGCIILDLDNFKKVNDNYGHLVGDQVLLEFVKRVQSLDRPYDLLGRYGGEEFVVLLPETSSEETCSVAVRMLGAVREKPFETTAGFISVTASAGASTSIGEDSQLEELLKRADDNLYQAKRSGRDRVFCDNDAQC
ncbi:MAG: GGDEF domain-containing protein [Geobacteraceae bacterium]|nr:GGDEF domain-containing protein [Geobacteraceae bacterium]